jgi:hypothetical protein
LGGFSDGGEANVTLQAHLHVTRMKHSSRRKEFLHNSKLYSSNA